MNQNTQRKIFTIYHPEEDSLMIWKEKFMDTEIRGDRDPDTEKKINLQLQRFIDFFHNRYGHDRVSVVTKRDVKAWLDELYKKGNGYAAATVNNHKAHLSLFMKWLHEKAPHLLPELPTKGRDLKNIQLPAPEPKALNDDQYLSVKNICDRLERFHQLKGRRWRGTTAPLNKKSRPKRDKAIMFVFLSTGIRREMMVNIDLKQLQPNDPDTLRRARKAKIVGIRGKGRTEVTKYLNEDARLAVADYIEFERPRDVDPESEALFLTVKEVPSRIPGGRMDKSSINRIFQQIAKWHDAEQTDPERMIGHMFTPHAMRHTYAFRLAREVEGDPTVLINELGHRNDRYISTYANRPEKHRLEYTEKL